MFSLASKSSYWGNSMIPSQTELEAQLESHASNFRAHQNAMQTTHMIPETYKKLKK